VDNATIKVRLGKGASVWVNADGLNGPMGVFSNGASTTRVGRIPEAVERSTRWMTPALAESGPVMRMPA
jgi:hypothetical protein